MEREPQELERVERMSFRHAQRHAAPAREPRGMCIRESTLRRDLGRPELAPVLEKRCKQDRLARNREAATLELRQPRELEVRERRDEVEIPVRVHRAPPASGKTSRSTLPPERITPTRLPATA